MHIGCAGQEEQPTLGEGAQVGTVTGRCPVVVAIRLKHLKRTRVKADVVTNGCARAAAGRRISNNRPRNVVGWIFRIITKCSPLGNWTIRARNVDRHDVLWSCDWS